MQIIADNQEIDAAGHHQRAHCLRSVAQLTGHLNIGMNNGLTQSEVAEAVAHLAFYVGWPSVFSAMPVAKEVFEKRPR